MKKFIISASIALLTAGTSSASLLFTIDFTNPSAVVITGTGNPAIVDYADAA